MAETPLKKWGVRKSNSVVYCSGYVIKNSEVKAIIRTRVSRGAFDLMSAHNTNFFMCIGADIVLNGVFTPIQFIIVLNLQSHPIFQLLISIIGSCIVVTLKRAIQNPNPVRAYLRESIATCTTWINGFNIQTHSLTTYQALELVGVAISCTSKAIICVDVYNNCQGLILYFWFLLASTCCILQILVQGIANSSH